MRLVVHLSGVETSKIEGSKSKTYNTLSFAGIKENEVDGILASVKTDTIKVTKYSLVNEK
jgi:hypothetical protein